MSIEENTMNLSERLISIAKFIPKCRCLADIGTDHGYIPIYILLNNISEKAIAGDIKKGPVAIAKKNISSYKLEDKIETRIGSGLSVLKKSEADVILIAGMGGNLIADIIEEHLDIASAADCLILQPVQYPEVLRKYLSKANFVILDEELANEGNKYYHIIKAKKGIGNEYEKEVYYYTGLSLIKKRHPLLIKYLNHKIHRINIIIKELLNSNNIERRNELVKLKDEFEEVVKWLNYVMK
jgi:tRNA (adenine22-N1)-methyltransferase